MMQFDPIDYFAKTPFDESLLIQFRFDETNGQVLIVYDYAAGTVSHHFERLASGDSVAPLPVRDFRRLILTDVRGVAIRDPAHRPGDKGYWQALNQEIARSTVEVQRASVRTIGGRYVLSMIIARSREYCIDFGSMLVAKRLAAAVPTNQNGVWKYVDTDSGEEFPYDEPFAARDLESKPE